MIQEPFAEGDSAIHRLNPKFKLVFVTLFSMVVAVSENFSTLIAALLFSAVMVLAARLNRLEAGKRIALAAGFLALLWLVLPLTYEGPALFSIGPLSLTVPGVVLSAQVTLKSIAILSALMALASTMTIATLGHALFQMGLPDKLIHLLLITYRYIFVLEQEYQRLVRAMKIRGFNPGTNLHSYKSMAYLMGMLFVRSSIRGERVYLAMKCRGFSGKFHTLQTFAPGRANWIFSLAMTGVITFLIGCELWAATN